MFDTITIRLKNIRKYKGIKDLLFDPNAGIRHFAISLDDKQELIYKGARNTRDFIDFLDKKHLIEKAYRKKMLASSNYEFQYNLNVGRDYMEFEFSIPKYIYGTNVFQALYHATDVPGAPRTGALNRFIWKKCKKGDQVSGNGNIEEAFNWLDKFIRVKFFKYMFPTVDIDYKDVWIARLDVCFNQVFKSKEAALEYLGYQRNIKKKYARDNSNYVRDWKTAITYVGSLYSAKIYHKGSEFRKKDRCELNKINDNLKAKGELKKYDLEILQDFADKTLRYEITCHSKMFSYVHMQNIFRNGSGFWNEQLKKYNQIRASLDKINADGKIEGWATVNKDERKFYKDMSKTISKRYEFCMEVTKEVAWYHKNSSSYIRVNQALFSEELIILLCQKLLDFFNEFQVEQKEQQSDVIEKMIKYNNAIKANNLLIKKRSRPLSRYEANVWKRTDLKGYQKFIAKKRKSQKRGLRLEGMRAFIAHLTAFGSYQELVNSKIYERRTIDLMAERFKKVGYDIKQATGSVAKLNVIKDFRGYHDYIMFNRNGLSTCFNYFM